MIPCRAFLTDPRGATAVEFALVFPLFVGMVVVVIQCGMLLWTQIALQHATQEAARCATVAESGCTSTAGIQNYAATQAYGLSIPKATFAVSIQNCGNQVSADYLYTFFISYLGGPSTTLHAQACYPK